MFALLMFVAGLALGLCIAVRYPETTSRIWAYLAVLAASVAAWFSGFMDWLGTLFVVALIATLILVLLNSLSVGVI